VSERALIDLAAVLPSDAVITDADVRATYARDESEAPPVVPEAVVRVRSTPEVCRTMEVAHRHSVPVTPRAAGTGRTGGAVPSEGGWVLALERFDRTLEIDEGEPLAVVEPGVVTGALRGALDELGLLYPPDPNSLATCTIGGNIAENAGGPSAVKYGVTRDYVLGLEVVLSDGTRLDVGRRTRKGVTGYDLTSLIVGSEGTLAIVTRATLRAIVKPEGIRTILAFFGAGDPLGAMRACRAAHVTPRCMELLDGETLAIVREANTLAIPSAARSLFIVEIDGEERALDGELERLGAELDAAGALEVLVAKHAGDRERLWSARREMSRALRTRAKHKLSEDVVVPRTKLGELIDRCRAIGDAHRVRVASYGHAGDGNLHVNFLWDEDDERPRVDAAIEALFRAVVEMGGTLSGEHGIGVLKAPYLSIEQPPELIALQERLKAQFDPRGILNPGKIFPRRGHGAC
jgi:glycolate oxidase